MRSRTLATASISVLCLILGACAQVPHSEVWRPWTRTSPPAFKLPLGSKISIKVEGETEPLLGTEAFTEEYLKTDLADRLKRRGFEIAPDADGLLLQVHYRVRRYDIMDYRSSSASYSSTYGNLVTGAGAGLAQGLGVSVARALAATSVTSATSRYEHLETIVSYTHTLALELRDRSGAPIWKADALWHSPSLEQRAAYGYAIQLVLSALPNDDRIAPEVPEVSPSHFLSYFKTECSTRTFACPALPHPIWFSRAQATSEGGAFSGASAKIDLKKISDPRALAAFADLASRAEYALPTGGDKYDDPLKADLWKRVRLGGQYIIGPSKTPVRLLMDLRGSTWGYSIERCWVASDSDYAAFQKQLRGWQDALVEYYGYYVK